MLDGIAEREVVGLTHGLEDLHVGTVERAQGQRTVHHEFHVAGAGGLLAGSRDLFRKVGCRIDAVSGLDAEVGHEHYLEKATHLCAAFDGRPEHGVCCFGDGVADGW